MIFLAFCCTAAQAAERMAVSVKEANIRSTPQPNGDVLWKIEKFHPIEVFETSGGRPEAAYASIKRAAARLGFRPRPSQTPYEYAAALGDALPSVRPEIQTVAHGRVETVYGRRELDEGELQHLRDAMMRVRLALPRLLLRRRPRRRP